jgi:cold shock protein
VPAGQVVEWKDRGYGFIKPDSGGRDLFFHAQHLEMDGKPAIGTRVVFEVADTDRGKQAVGVRAESTAAALAEDAWDECEVLNPAGFREMFMRAVEPMYEELLRAARKHGWVEDAG